MKNKTTAFKYIAAGSFFALGIYYLGLFIFFIMKNGGAPMWAARIGDRRLMIVKYAYYLVLEFFMVPVAATSQIIYIILGISSILLGVGIYSSQKKVAMMGALTGCVGPVCLFYLYMKQHHFNFLLQGMLDPTKNMMVVCLVSYIALTIALWKDEFKLPLSIVSGLLWVVGYVLRMKNLYDITYHPILVVALFALGAILIGFLDLNKEQGEPQYLFNE